MQTSRLATSRAITTLALSTLAATAGLGLSPANATATGRGAAPGGSTAANAPDEFQVVSGEGDAMGAGGTVDFVGPGAISNPVTYNGLNHVGFTAGPATAKWGVDFYAPGGQPLAVGDYTNAVDDHGPGLEMSPITIHHGTCDHEYSSFHIYEITADAKGNLTSLNATFEHRCNATDAAPSVGFVRWNATLPTPIPTLPSSAGALPGPDPTAGGAPTEMNLQGLSTSYIGGDSIDLTPSWTTMNMAGTPGDVGIAAREPDLHADVWNVELAAPKGQQLHVGTYSDATLIPSAGNPYVPGASPGIAVRYNGVPTCYDMTGEFTVYQIESDPETGAVTKLNASFVSHCGGKSTPDVNGYLHYNATVAPAPTPTPTPTPVPIPVPGPNPGPAQHPTAQRIAGPDRYTTGALAAEALWRPAADPNAHGEPAQAAVLATGQSFPDALAGGPLAAHVHGPLLLTESTKLTGVTETEIQRDLKPGSTVYVLGGQAAVGDAVVRKLEGDGYTVVRYGGADRFATARQIASRTSWTSNKTVVATGRSFADALSAGPLAATLDAPILLSDGAVLDPATKAAITARGGATFAVGGPAGTAVKGQAPSAANQYFAGSDRYITSAEVAAAVKANGNGTPSLVAGLATGLTYPDALTGGALMANLRQPILLTDPKNLPAATATALSGMRPTLAMLTIFGGTGAISTPVAQAAATAAGTPLAG